MLKKINFFLIIIFSFFVNSYSFSENNILFIDIEYIYFNSNAGKIVNKKIKLETKKINDEFSGYKKKVQVEKDKLINQKNILSQEELQKKSIELNKQIREYDKIIANKNKHLIKYKNETKIEFTKKLAKIVQVYASNNSIEMIIKKNNILIGKNELDATEEVLNLFNKDIKSIEVK
jgi:outer membrane protein